MLPEACAGSRKKAVVDMARSSSAPSHDALFTREGMPPIKDMLPCSLQHVLASFAGIITPAIIIA